MKGLVIRTVSHDSVCCNTPLDLLEHALVMKAIPVDTLRD